MNKLRLLTLSFLLIKQISVAQKISVLFDAVPTTLPTVNKAPLKYNKSFAYSFTLDDATVDAFKAALPILRGGTIPELGATFPGYFYTDGCGNDVVFKCGIAWNSANLNGIDTHTGEVLGMLTWKELDSLYNLGWDVMNHSYSHKSRWVLNMSASDYTNEIIKNQEAVKSKTLKNIEMPVFVVPSGDAIYQDFALQLGHKVVFDQSGEVSGFAGFQVDGNISLDGLRIHRQLFEEGLSTNTLDRAYSKTLNGGHYWYNEFTHRIDDYTSQGFYFYSFKNQMQKVADSWGKNGNDRMWMAPLQEVFEYLVVRQALSITTDVAGNKLDIKLDVSKVPSWVRRKAITLVINSTTNFSKVETSSDIKTTFNGKAQTKIINIDFSDYSKGTAVKEFSPSLARLYPNPTGDVLNIQLLVDDKNEETVYTIMDITGKVIQTSKIVSNHLPLSIQHLMKGIYILKIQQGNKLYTSKFVKE